MSDTRSQQKNLPLSGKLMLADPASIGENFQTLKNYRYTDTHIRGIRGMTELGGMTVSTVDDWGNGDGFGNSDDWGIAGSYYNVKTAHHFVKTAPTETHLITQRFSSSGLSSGLYDSTATIPTSAAFTETQLLFNSGTNSGYFCDAPDGKVVFCNGADTHIWAGDEGICPCFITSEAAVTTALTNPVDYSNVISNTKTDSANRALVGASALTFLVGSTMQLKGCKFYTTATANSTVSSMGMTYWNGSAWTTASITDNTSSPAYSEVFADAMTTAGGWTSTGNATLVSTSGGQSGNCLSIAASASASAAAYHDITTVSGRKYKFSGYFKKGTSANGSILIGTSASAAAYWDSGDLSDADWTAYTTSITATATATRITLKTNDDTAGETSLFDTVSMITGITLATSGTVTWTSTVDLAKPLFLEGYYLYWYQFTITDGDAYVYYCTQQADFQKMKDLWDGVYRDVLRFYKHTTTNLDQTTEVLVDDYYYDDPTTYSDLSSLAAYNAGTGANSLIMGFEEKQTGIFFNIPSDYTNSTASTTAAADYWNGTAWTTCGTCVDGTAEGGIAFAKPGCITWNSGGLTGESVRSIDNSPPLYFYQVRFDEAMDASVRLNYVGGITAQIELTYYRFPIFAQGRLLLCNDQSGQRNKLICSGKYTPHVFNGADTAEVWFGNDEAITCGVELFSLFGSSLYSLILIFKNFETWIVTGADIDAWADNTFLLSSNIGCPAPLTLKTINLHAEPGAGINRTLAIWQSANGIYMSDGRAPIPIHGDIAEYFNPESSLCIPAAMIGESIGEIDPVMQEYHWLFASGSGATAINKELVYDIKRNRWFEIDRGTDKRLNNIRMVHDSYGQSYVYGFRPNGKVYRLEYGATMDGNDITHTFHTGDLPLAGLTTESQVDRIRVIAKSRLATSDAMTITHYADTAETGTDKTFSSFDSERRITQNVETDKLIGDVFHSFKGVTTTHDETTGPEPLALAITYHPTHKD